MRRPSPNFLTALLAGALALASCPASAQTNIPWNVAEGSYSESTNWNHPFGAFLPDAGFDEVALIGNGGTAFVEDTPDPTPAGVIINAGSTLEIRSGGNLTAEVGAEELALGAAAVNGGRLVLLSGGSFTAESLSSGAAGTIDLSGTAHLTINGASQLAGTTRIVGPDVNFATASLINSGTISAGITGAMHSAINVSGQATLGGAVVLEFDGVTPAFGDAWEIVDAQSITGNFGSVTTNVTPGPGLAFASQIVSGGNGQIAQVALEARLTLQVNRRTGEVQIRDLAGIEATTIDGYLIGSPGGTLDPSEWNQLGQADWIPSDGGATHIGEATLTGQVEIGTGEAADLGSLYANPARQSEFGVTVEDITFDYSLKTGEVLTGLVDYTDAHNTVVLVVDPDTGDTWIQNQSVFDVDIDGYEIESVSGALDPSEWISFAASDGGWTEANPVDQHIGELSLGGSRTLDGEGDAISLGRIFTPGAERDLLFRFNTAPSDGGMAVTYTGVVEYDDGPIDFGPGGGTVPGDYNNNGRVEQADLDLVLLNWGQSFTTLPDDWMNERPTEGIIDQAELDGVLLNWGNMAGLSTAAVPEPMSCVLAVLSLCCLAVRLPRRRA